MTASRPSAAFAQGRCIAGSPALFPPLPREARGRTVPAGEWCNGNTAVFGTVILGSSPSSPASFKSPNKINDLNRGSPRFWAVFGLFYGIRHGICRRDTVAVVEPPK